MKTITTIEPVKMAACITTACRKKNTPKTSTPPTEAEWNKLLDYNLDDLTQTTSFGISNNAFVFTTNKGATITINGSCLRDGGNAVSRAVNLNVVEMYDNVGRALTNKTTMALNPATGQKEQTETGGVFYVMATKDGEPLTATCPIKIDIPMKNTKGPKSGTQAFEGKITNGELTWEISTKYEVVQSLYNGKYPLTPTGFGWFNADNFYNDPRPRTAIKARVPSGNGVHSVVYIITKSFPCSLGGLAGYFPIGLDCWLVFVSRKDGKYLGETKKSTLTANHSVKFDLSTAQTGSRPTM